MRNEEETNHRIQPDDWSGLAFAQPERERDDVCAAAVCDSCAAYSVSEFLVILRIEARADSRRSRTYIHTRTYRFNMC